MRTKRAVPRAEGSLMRRPTVTVDGTEIARGIVEDDGDGIGADQALELFARRGWQVVILVDGPGEVEPWHEAHPHATIKVRDA